MMREECAKEFTSLDAEKISAIQINTGSQYLRNARNLSTANQNRIQRAGQSEYGAHLNFWTTEKAASRRDILKIARRLNAGV